MRKTARTVVWEGAGAQSPAPDPIDCLNPPCFGPQPLAGRGFGSVVAAKNFPAVVLTGLRRSGKTFFLQQLLRRASYYLFEEPDIVGRFRHDPQGFLDGVKPPRV